MPQQQPRLYAAVKHIRCRKLRERMQPLTTCRSRIRVSEGDLFRIHGNHGIGQVLIFTGADAEKLTGFTVTEDFLYNKRPRKSQPILLAER